MLKRIYLIGLLAFALGSCNQKTKTRYKVTYNVYKDSLSGLIIDRGYVEVKQTCTVCHSSKLVIQNRATRDGWLEMIRWMQEKHKLWDLKENEDVILDYLARNYPPVDKGRRPALEGIEWYELKDN